MAKKARKKRGTKHETRETNWVLVGGLVGAGIIALFALLYLSLRNQDNPAQAASDGQPIAEFCKENPDNCVTKGSDEAPVTIVEISDYGCGHCKNFNLETAGLLNDLYVTPGQVKWVILPYALGAQTAPAAEAAMCANEQGNFFDYHHRLFEMQDEPDLFMTRAGFRQAAEDVGLDPDALEQCLDAGGYANTIQQNIRAAAALGVSSTPTFFINGEMARGNQPLTFFQQRINDLLGAADGS